MVGYINNYGIIIFTILNDIGIINGFVLMVEIVSTFKMFEIKFLFAEKQYRTSMRDPIMLLRIAFLLYENNA